MKYDARYADPTFKQGSFFEETDTGTRLWNIWWERSARRCMICRAPTNWIVGPFGPLCSDECTQKKIERDA